MSVHDFHDLPVIGVCRLDFIPVTSIPCPYGLLHVVLGIEVTLHEEEHLF